MESLASVQSKESKILQIHEALQALCNTEELMSEFILELQQGPQPPKERITGEHSTVTFSNVYNTLPGAINDISDRFLSHMSILRDALL